MMEGVIPDLLAHVQSVSHGGTEVVADIDPRCAALFCRLSKTVVVTERTVRNCRSGDAVIEVVATEK